MTIRLLLLVTADSLMWVVETWNTSLVLSGGAVWSDGDAYITHKVVFGS
jgi:hypothetical protein